MKNIDYDDDDFDEYDEYDDENVVGTAAGGDDEMTEDDRGTPAPIAYLTLLTFVEIWYLWCK